ncbi:hypothetical protein LXA43DRAFT_1066576 [Ganoderma leucocontextum]|nr:hypothetical protein LXA43DRAFT_1066576 [Ganoderma leucocontextum]
MLAFLQRSRSAPVSLSTYLALPHQGNAGAIVAAVLDSCRERLRRLDVRLHAYDIFTHSRIDFAASNLECLTIQCELYDGVEIVHYPLLLQGQTTSLRALALLHIRHWLPANLFPSLVHLNISYFYMEELPLPMLSHFLAGCPRLETLHIGEVWSYPLLDLDLTPPVQKVHMPYLRSISTCCTTLQTASHILSSLELPPKTRIRIHNAPVSAHTTVDDNRLPSLAFMQPLTRLELAANNTTLYLVAEGEAAGIWIQAKWEGGSPSVWPAWLRQLPETVPLASVREFHISLVDWSILPGLLSCMPTLSTLGVMALPDDPTHQPMISTLQSAVETPALCPWLSRCPGLSTLSIQCNTTPDVGGIVSLMTRDSRRLSRLVLDFPGGVSPEPFLGKVDEIEIGCGGICIWKKRSGWDVENEYWRLPEEDEPRCVLPWTAAAL